MRASRARLAVLGLSLGLLPCHAVLAARPDASIAAGAQARPDLTFLSHANGACTHYVATTGNDNNNGGQAAPWRTIGKALRTLRPGNVGCVAAGTYVEGAAQAAYSGEPARPIVLRRQPGSPSRPVVTPNGAVAVFHMDRDYWVVDGFDVDLRGQRVTGFRWWHNADFGALRNSRLHGGSAGANVYIAGRDFLMEGNEVHDNFRPDDEDAHGILVPAEATNAARILIRRNTIHDNGGDGFQCENHGDGVAAGTPRDITLEDNRIYTSPANWGRVEQAVDIKSCRQVTIRGSVPPYLNNARAADNKFFGFREREGQAPAEAPSAIVIHFGAKKVLVENTRIWDSCNALGVGRGGDASYLTAEVVFRRNVVFQMYRNPTPGSRCRGYGLSLNRADNVDIYHNTFDAIPAFALSVSVDNLTGTPNRNIDVWNNIVRGARPWMRVSTSPSRTSGLASDRNFFWNDAADTAQFQVDGSARTLAQWRGLAGSAAVGVADPTSSNKDPMIVSMPAQNDYYLQAGSPALDAALANTGAPYAGRGPDVGFRETYGP